MRMFCPFICFRHRNVTHCCNLDHSNRSHPHKVNFIHSSILCNYLSQALAVVTVFGQLNLNKSLIYEAEAEDGATVEHYRSMHISYHLHIICISTELNQVNCAVTVHLQRRFNGIVQNTHTRYSDSENEMLRTYMHFHSDPQLR